jgi:hypothetical protein
MDYERRGRNFRADPSVLHCDIDDKRCSPRHQSAAVDVHSAHLVLVPDATNDRAVITKLVCLVVLWDVDRVPILDLRDGPNGWINGEGSITTVRYFNALVVIVGPIQPVDRFSKIRGNGWVYIHGRS